ncbi:hypothetical protein ACWEKT_07290 [Nocardia takedensis]
MSRRPTSRPTREQRSDAAATPITQIPQLADAARHLGQTDRVIMVDPAPPQQLHTPGAQLGRWFVSGASLDGWSGSDWSASERDGGVER